GADHWPVRLALARPARTCPASPGSRVPMSSPECLSATLRLRLHSDIFAHPIMKNAFKVAFFVLSAALSFHITAAEDHDGFKPIFNGKDLTGWDGNPKFWSVR